VTEKAGGIAPTSCPAQEEVSAGLPRASACFDTSVGRGVHNSHWHRRLVSDVPASLGMRNTGRHGFGKRNWTPANVGDRAERLELSLRLNRSLVLRLSHSLRLKLSHRLSLRLVRAYEL
jgi:hypothetical protein